MKIAKLLPFLLLIVAGKHICWHDHMINCNAPYPSL
jgi:hypothetical protein